MAAANDAIQRVLHVTARVHVYQIPPMQSNKGYSAASWTNSPPIFTARLRVLETSLPGKEKVNTAVLLEDPNSGELFAACPYTSKAVVSPALDSSRFFAVRVQGEGGMKATLGVGFEERSDAIDFGICLQEVDKILGLVKLDPKVIEPPKKDYSLKEGEMIKINIGSRRPQGKAPALDKPTTFLPPPPSAAQVRSQMKREDQSFDDDFGDFQG